MNSTGVIGLTATLPAGVFNSGSGNLIFTVSGTPSSTGTASFPLNIGGKTCTLTINIVNNPALFKESDYIGVYKGKHLISDPTLISIIKGIDPSNDGSFLDTITVSTGTNPNDKIMDFTSKFFGGTIQVDFNKTSQNVLRKENLRILLDNSGEVTIENVVVKATSEITLLNSSKFNSSLNFSGTLTSGSTTFPIGNFPLTGTFTK